MERLVFNHTYPVISQQINAAQHGLAYDALLHYNTAN